jgi:hypothetical protein
MPDKEKGKLPNWAKVFATSGQLSDLGSTIYGLQHGAHEANPIMPQGLGPIVATKAGTTIGGLYGLSKLAESHPKLAKGLSIGMGSAGFIPALINTYRLTRK